MPNFNSKPKMFEKILQKRHTCLCTYFNKSFFLHLCLEKIELLVEQKHYLNSCEILIRGGEKKSIRLCKNSGETASNIG